MSRVLGKVSIFFLYMNFIPGLMSVTFLFLKSFDILTPYFMRLGRLIFVQKPSTDKYFETLKYNIRHNDDDFFPYSE